MGRAGAGSDGAGADGHPPPAFGPAFRDELRELFRWRRDVRRFRGDPVDPALVRALLEQACLSPSVGNAQPWRFVLVESAARRRCVLENFLECNADALDAQSSASRRALYARLKLAGLREAPVQIAAFCASATHRGHGLGRRTIPESLEYSVVAAVQTLWLAARAHGLGVGWVSILDPGRVRTCLEVPANWSLVAYLCLGHPEEEHLDPELSRQGWQRREPLDSFIVRR